jgi:hypothetical protein
MANTHRVPLDETQTTIPPRRISLTGLLRANTLPLSGRISGRINLASMRSSWPRDLPRWNHDLVARGRGVVSVMRHDTGTMI